MEIAFNAIGLKISNENTFSDIAASADRNGESSVLLRKSGKLHGRCWKLGAGLEVWSVLYESTNGEILRNDCRPAFRARRAQQINPWLLSESAEQGEAVIHGFIENTDAEVLFELQNLTEIGAEMFQEKVLQVGLCGLAYRAKVFKSKQIPFWQSYDEITLNVIANERDWSLCGRVIAFDTVQKSIFGKRSLLDISRSGRIQSGNSGQRERSVGREIKHRNIYQSRHLAARSYFETDETCRLRRH